MVHLACACLNRHCGEVITEAHPWETFESGFSPSVFQANPSVNMLALLSPSSSVVPTSKL